MTSILLRSFPAHAQNTIPIEYRASQSIGKTDDVTQYALAFQVRPPRRLRAHHLELALGAFSSDLEDRPIVSLGAVWRLQKKWLPAVVRERIFVDVGLSPTWIAGSNVNGRNPGGNIHFTSSVSVGAHLNQRRTLDLSLRVQHTSNAGLNSMNPGLDMVGLSLTFQPE